MIYFDKAVVQSDKIKQKNVSIDVEKTKQRVTEVWKGSKNADKNIAEELAGIHRSTIYRIFKEGTINAKIVLTISQVMNVDPNYIIGKTEEPGECTEELLKQFLTDCGYGELIPNEEPVEKKTRKSRSKAVDKEDKPADDTADTDDTVVPGETEEPASEVVESCVCDCTCGGGAEEEGVIEAVKEEPIAPDIQELINNITEDELIQLMRTVIFKGKFGKKNAKKADDLKKLLLFD